MGGNERGWFLSARFSAWNSVTTAVPKAEPGALGAQWTPSKMGGGEGMGSQAGVGLHQELRGVVGHIRKSLGQKRPQSVISSPP